MSKLTKVYTFNIGMTLCLSKAVQNISADTVYICLWRDCFFPAPTPLMHHRSKTEATHLVKRNRGLRSWGSCCNICFIRLCHSRWLSLWDRRWVCSRWGKRLKYIWIGCSRCSCIRWEIRSHRSFWGRKKAESPRSGRMMGQPRRYGKTRNVVEEGSRSSENPGIWGYPGITVRIPRVIGELIPCRIDRRSEITVWYGIRNIQSWVNWVRTVRIAAVILNESKEVKVITSILSLHYLCYDCDDVQWVKVIF